MDGVQSFLLRTFLVSQGSLVMVGHVSRVKKVGNFLLLLPPSPIYVLSWTLLSWDSENTMSHINSGTAGVGSEQLGCQCLAHHRHSMRICEFCKVEFFVLIHLVDWPDVEDILVHSFFFFFRILHGHQNDYMNGGFQWVFFLLVSIPSCLIAEISVKRLLWGSGFYCWIF